MGLNSILYYPNIMYFPASVGFDFFERNKRIADSDADYVQIIHTDGDKFGFGSPLGHGKYISASS